MKNFDKAVEYYEMDLKICIALADHQDQATTLLNLACNMLKGKGDEDRAFQYLEEALALAEEEHDVETVMKCLVNLGSLASQLSRYQEALGYFEMCNEICEEMQQMGMQSITSSMQIELMSSMVKLHRGSADANAGPLLQSGISAPSHAILSHHEATWQR